jgi:hypothetical protein
MTKTITFTDDELRSILSALNLLDALDEASVLQLSVASGIARYLRSKCRVR